MSCLPEGQKGKHMSIMNWMSNIGLVCICVKKAIMCLVCMRVKRQTYVQYAPGSNIGLVCASVKKIYIGLANRCARCCVYLSAGECY